MGLVRMYVLDSEARHGKKNIHFDNMPKGKLEKISASAAISGQNGFKKVGTISLLTVFCDKSYNDQLHCSKELQSKSTHYSQRAVVNIT